MYTGLDLKCHCGLVAAKLQIVGKVGVMEKRRVVITGMGAVTPFGVSYQAFWQALTEGQSAVRRITKFDPLPHMTQIAAEVQGFDPLEFMDKKDTLRMDSFIQYAVAAATEAVKDASPKLSEIAERTGVIIGSGMGGIPRLIEAHNLFLKDGPSRTVPYMLTAIIPNMAAGWISQRLGAKGPTSSPSTACAAGSHAIGDAFRLIQLGYADMMIAGGSEAVVTPIVLWGFDSIRALSSRNDNPAGASRPFDDQRDGFVLGEGAGTVVLEERERAVARGARIHAELCGYAMTADAHHSTAPSPDARGAATCMALALGDAGLSPMDIDYISAHGTSTPMNDVVETKAIKQVFGSHAQNLAVSSIKSMIGHSLGASGALATISTIMAIRHQTLPPTINHESPDLECNLDYVPNCARHADVRAAMVNAFAFGGANAVLVVKRDHP